MSLIKQAETRKMKKESKRGKGIKVFLELCYYAILFMFG